MTVASHPPTTGFPLPPRTRRAARNAPTPAQRLVFFLLLALLAAASAVAVSIFAWPGVERWVNVGRLEDFPPGSVTSFGQIKPVFHMVRLDNGELLAVSAENLFARPDCAVAYDPDFERRDQKGLFRDTCYPWAFDLTGYAVNFWFTSEVQRPMLGRLPLEIRDGAVYVDPRAIEPGESQARERHELQYGATLMPAHHYSPGD